MTEILFGLREFRDAGAFLSGARIPITHVWPKPFKSVEWAADHFVIENDGRLWRDDIRPDTLWLLALDLTAPDVARWVDRQIASRIARHPFLWAALVITDGFFDVVWGAGHVIGRCGVDHMVDSVVARDAKHLPTARAAVLRSMFGSANV